MSLTNREMARLGELLDEALALTPEQRRVWLDSLSSVDQPLVRTLRDALLAEDTGRAGRWTARRASRQAAPTRKARPAATRASGSAPTSCCGRWGPAAWRTSGSPAAPTARSIARWR